MALLLFAVGAAVRLRVFLYNRSLWRDEAALGLTYLRQGYLDLLSTGDYFSDQVAPIVFSLLERLAVDLLGGTDWSLRLLPLAAGLASLPLVYVVARRLAGRVVAVLSLGFLATDWMAIYFSSEVKQYSTDLLAALLLFWLAGEEPGRLGRRRALVLGVGGALLCFASQPVVFAMAALGLGLAAANLEGGWTRERVIPLAMVAGAWLIGFGLNWVLFLRPQMAHDWLYDYHADAFLPLVPRSVAEVQAVATQLARAIGGMTGFVATELAVFLFLTGLVVLAYRRAYLALAFALQWVVAYAASSLHVFPFSARVILFTLPGILFTVAVGLHGLVAGRRGWPALALAGALLVGWFNVGQTASYLVDPAGSPRINRVQTRAALDYVREHGRPGDAVYAFYSTTYTVEFYRDRHLPSDMTVVYGSHRREGQAAFARDVRQIARLDRVWVLFNGFTRSRNRAFVLDEIARAGGVELDRYEFHGEPDGPASAYLFEFRRPET